MSKYVEVRHATGSQQFAILIEGSDGVDTIGVSPQGKEWEAWADALPASRRSTLAQLTATLGPHLSVSKPALLTHTLRDEFAALAERVRVTKGKPSAPTIVN